MAPNPLWTFHPGPGSNDQRTASAELERAGVVLCRMGEWKRGVDQLERLLTAPAEKPAQALSPLGLSFLGLGWLRLRRQGREGLAICEQAARRDFYEPEILLNLAEAYLAANQRGRAAGAVARGLKIDPDHQQLLELMQRLGPRRPPIFSSLPRQHALNRVAGKIRHGVRGDSRSKA